MCRYSFEHISFGWYTEPKYISTETPQCSAGNLSSYIHFTFFSITLFKTTQISKCSKTTQIYIIFIFLCFYVILWPKKIIITKYSVYLLDNCIIKMNLILTFFRTKIY
ncbi:hypothetical protein HanIR_Chr10g0452681 [Helianthus annuus]|nr:hypothetical protein HanIR_Chr10g0452681 [Helianthus annuus]